MTQPGKGPGWKPGRSLADREAEALARALAQVNPKVSGAIVGVSYVVNPGAVTVTFASGHKLVQGIDPY